MSLRQLLNTAYSVIASSLPPEKAQEFHDELYAPPGEKARPRSRGTKKLMAMMGMAPPPPAPPAAQTEGA